MVEPGFLDKFKRILLAIEDVHGAVSLFALLKMDDLTEKWTVLLGAKWVDESRYDEYFFLLRRLMLKELNEAESRQIARMGIFDLNDHLTQVLLDKYKSNEHIAGEERLNGNLVHEAYILKSVKGLHSDQQRLV